jgi:hypothetical protein
MLRLMLASTLIIDTSNQHAEIMQRSDANINIHVQPSYLFDGLYNSLVLQHISQVTE